MMISIIIIILADFVVSDTNGFIYFCLKPLVTRGERRESLGPVQTILC